MLVVPKANPAGIESVEDVLRPGTRLVVAAEGVPVGDYTRTVLETLGLSEALDNVVSNEDDVKGVDGKVSLGEADAGFVYATDVTPVADRGRSRSSFPTTPSRRSSTRSRSSRTATTRRRPRRSSRSCSAPRGGRRSSAPGFVVPT